MGSPKSSAAAEPPMPVSVSSNAVSEVVDAVTVAQKAMSSSNEGSEGGVPPTAKATTSMPPKPQAEASQNNGEAPAVCKRSPQLSSSSAPTALATPGKSASQQKVNSLATGTPEQSEPTKETAGQGAAAAVRCKTKEELRKNPGTVIVPCRARGMVRDMIAIVFVFPLFSFIGSGNNYAF
jgi:hypothetical protein